MLRPQTKSFVLSGFNINWLSKHQLLILVLFLLLCVIDLEAGKTTEAWYRPRSTGQNNVVELMELMEDHVNAKKEWSQYTPLGHTTDHLQTLGEVR